MLEITTVSAELATVTAGGIMIESTVMRVSDLLPTTLLLRELDCLSHWHMALIPCEL